MRICAVCKKGIRDGDAPIPVRLDPADITPELKVALKVTVDILPGLQSTCSDCVAIIKPVIAARVGQPVETMADDYLA